MYADLLAQLFIDLKSTRGGEFYNTIHSYCIIYLYLSMDKISDLAFFCLLAKTVNFTLAAKKLGLTPPAISKRLAQLERRLGVRLFNRTTRRVGLTPEGEVYLRSASRILSEIDDLEQVISSSKAVPKGLMRVNATFGFGRTYVAPAISAFLKQYSKVEVQLQLTDSPLNLSAQGYDLGIWFDELPDTRLIARKIASNPRVILAAPSYLEKFGSPKTPADLIRHNCIIRRHDDMAQTAWRFSVAAKTVSIKVRGGLSTNDGDVALKWALDGHGILMHSTHTWGLNRHVRSGKLVVVLKDFKLPPADVFAVFPQRHNLSAKVRVFIDFLVSRFKNPRIFDLPPDT